MQGRLLSAHLSLGVLDRGLQMRELHTILPQLLWVKH